MSATQVDWTPTLEGVSFYRRWRGAESRLAHPGYGCCGRCGMSWGTLGPEARHVTTYNGSMAGCFPLCARCWGELTPETRLPYYERMVDNWAADPGDDAHRVEAELDRVLIRSAVLAGG